MFATFADASDIDDMNVLGDLVKRPAKEDLALVLQEVQDLETKTKKRRLERKHSSTVGEVDPYSNLYNQFLSVFLYKLVRLPRNPVLTWFVLYIFSHFVKMVHKAHLCPALTFLEIWIN